MQTYSTGDQLGGLNTNYTITQRTGPSRVFEASSQGSIHDPELFVHYEKVIINKFLHEKRIILGGLSDQETDKAIEEFKKRFHQHFRHKKLDFILTSLNDKEKMRFIATLKNHIK